MMRRFDQINRSYPVNVNRFIGKRDKTVITKQTAGRIWNCYHDIETGEKLLADMQEQLEKGDVPNPRDGWGTRRPLTLGLPSGNSSHRMLDVAPGLALSIIRAHIADKRKELAIANEAARVESQTNE